MITSPAAVCQCLTLVSLCTSIADPNWIHVRNATDPDGKQLIYGVAFTLHAAQNLTDTGPLGGVNGWGMWLLYALAGLCYAAVLSSTCSFLLDFLGGTSRPRLLVSLHLSTVALLLSILGVWGVCLYIIYHNLQGGKRWLWGWAAVGGLGRPWSGSGAAGMRAYPGESFYIALLGLLFSCLASAASVSDLRRPPPRHVQGGYTAVAGGGEEDRVTEPLIPRPPVQGEERGEEWGAVFPE